MHDVDCGGLWCHPQPSQVESSPLQLLVCTDRGFLVGLRARTYALVQICLYLSKYTPHRTIQAPAPHLLMPAHSLNRFKARHLGSAGEVAVAVSVTVTSVPSCRKPWSISAGKIGILSVKSRPQYYCALLWCFSLPEWPIAPVSTLLIVFLFPEQPDGGRTTVVFSIEVN